MTEVESDWYNLKIEVKVASLYFTNRESYFSKLALFPDIFGYISSCFFGITLANRYYIISVIFAAFSIICGGINIFFKPCERKFLFSAWYKKTSALEKKIVLVKETTSTYKELKVELLSIIGEAPNSIKVLHWICMNRVLLNEGRNEYRIEITPVQQFLATWFSFDYKAEALDDQFAKKSLLNNKG